MAKILIVDDIEQNREMLSRRLMRRKHDVDTVESGAGALEVIHQAIIANEGYDVILLDIMMPKMNGMQVLEQLRKDDRTAQLAVIMVTARAESKQIVESLEGGADDYVTKPIDFAVLLARMAKAISNREALSAAASAVSGPATTASVGPGPGPGAVKVPTSFGPGTILQDRYQLNRVIGQGGFAIVYEAKQLSTGQLVAIKMLYDDVVNATQLARFDREMQLIAQLKHPNVVRLVDCGYLENGSPGLRPDPGLSAITRRTPPDLREMPAEGARPSTPFIVMELLEGEDLRRRIERDGAMTIAVAIDLMLPIASAMMMAHRNNVVHRDLKPSNIFLARGESEGTVVPIVLDFGIAKPAGPESGQITVDSSFIGTPEYMAPEQTLGADFIDERADQYALALLTYELLAGRSPFAGLSFFRTIRAVSNGKYPRPSSAIGGLPLGLEAVIVRAMSRSRSDRYESMAEFGRQLLPFASASGRAIWSRSFADEATGESDVPQVEVDADEITSQIGRPRSQKTGSGPSTVPAPPAEEIESAANIPK